MIHCQFKRLTLKSLVHAALLTLACAAVPVGLAEPLATEDWSAADGEGWPSQWTRHNVTEGVGDDASVSTTGERGKIINPNQGEADHKIIHFINTQTAQDVEQSVTVSIGTTVATAGLVARRQDTASNTFYMVQVGARYNLNEELNLGVMIDGNYTKLASNEALFATVTPDSYRLRFNVSTNDQGTTDLRVKFWPAAEPEPDAWTLEKLGDDTAALQGVGGRFGTWSDIVGRHRATEFDDYKAVNIKGSTPAPEESSHSDQLGPSPSARGASYINDSVCPPRLD